MSEPLTPHEASAPTPTPPPPPHEGTPWGKVVGIGCLVLFLLGVVLAVAAYFAFRYVKDQQASTVAEPSRQTDEPAHPGGGMAPSRQVRDGTLGPGDETQQDGSWYDAWPFELADGARVVFLLESDDFDTYLTVVSPGGETSSDDDSGGGTDSRIELTAHESGTWNVLANSLRAGDSGSYRLTIETH